jgi:CubicO group peptidase (beta-lactamase class C family)
MNAEPHLIFALDPSFGPWARGASAPGAVLAVLSGGGVRAWTSYGRAGASTAEPLTAESVFYVASVSKQFTAACVTCCEMDGLLGVDAPIRSYLPELPALFDPISVRHLLHHLGGLPHGGAGGLSASAACGEGWPEGLGLWDLIAILAKEPALLQAPGEAYAYSNCGYWLLAGAVERASGRTLRQFARQRLFEPLGMADSRFRDDPDRLERGLVLGHVAEGDAYHPIETRFHAVGDGGLLTSLEDLARWDLFWSGRSSLGQELPRRLTERGRRNDGAALSYARGVSVRSHRGLPIVSHGGSFLGYESKFVRFPEQDFSIACLANVDDLNVDALALAAADMVLGSAADWSKSDWRQTVRTDAVAFPPPVIPVSRSEDRNP